MQFYAPTSGHGDSEVDRFTTPGNHRQNAKEGHSGCTGGGGGGGGGNAEVGKGAHADLGDVCGPYCIVDTNERTRTSRVCNLK